MSKCSKSVRSNRTSYRFHSIHFLVIRFRALVCEGSKQSVHSFSFTSLRFIRSHTVCIELASSHGGLCVSSQAMKAQSAANATVPLRGPSAFCICLFPQVGLCCKGYGRESRQVPTSRNINSSGFAVDTKSPQLKTAGTQKVFPLSPLRTPLSPSQKNKVCNLTLGGTGGTLFAQHCSCPAVLRCYIGS